jgi:hypothetical protein
MTTQEIIIGIKLKLSNNVKFRNIDDRRILFFLNITQNQILTTSLIQDKSTNLFESYNASYELLQCFINTIDLPIQQVTGKDQYFFILPENYLLMLNNSQLINKDRSINIKVLKTSISTDISYLPYFKNNFLFENVVEYDNKIYLSDNKSNILKLSLSYIRKPNDITVDSKIELSLLYHYTLLENTVSNILKSFEDINSLQLNETKI